MSLPIAGGAGGGSGSRHPSRAPTHKSLPHQKMMNLGVEVEELAAGEPVSCDAVEELALELGVDTSQLLASAATTTDVEIAREHEVAFVGCGGICQNWGALECLETLVELRRERLDAGQPGFDIMARSCLDQCEHAPAFLVHTPGGTALLKQATPQALREAVAETCD